MIYYTILFIVLIIITFVMILYIAVWLSSIHGHHYPCNVQYSTLLKPGIRMVDSCLVLSLSCISLCFSSSHQQYWKQSCSSYCFSSSHQQYLEHSCYELALSCIVLRKSFSSHFLIARRSWDKTRTLFPYCFIPIISLFSFTSSLFYLVSISQSNLVRSLITY